MEAIKNQRLEGASGKPLLVDIYWTPTSKPLPIILFCHGFKGFKDWGHWEVIAKEFAQAGYCFVKFNFSHNGTTPEFPLDFADLEAFGQNNYSKELKDLEIVLDWITQPEASKSISLNTRNITLIGHSRGGPIALLGAINHPSVLKVVTWAGVHRLDYAWQKEGFSMEDWKEKGVYHVLNGRTKQEMPLYYQLYENYKANETQFSMPQILSKLPIPYLIVHGTNDPAVSIDSAYDLHQKSPHSTLVLIDGANHVFDGKHPFDETQLPPSSRQLVAETVRFIKNTQKES